MTVPLPPAGDPDRFDPDRVEPDRVEPAVEGGPIDWVLDPTHDPDRFVPPVRGRDETLQELLGEGSQETARDNWTWLVGLGTVIGFLLLVSLLVQLGHR